MIFSNFFWVIFFLFFNKCFCKSRSRSPHLIFILADDLGWNDVSFHGSNEILTPNIDALAFNGVILNNHYSETLCSPSRAALLTGKYPIHTGMHHNVIMETHASGLSLKERLLPQYLQKLGYKSHAVGKWHLGFYKKEYTPLYRGFNSFYGLWNGYHDYYKHNTQAFFVPYDGYDMRRNMSVDWSAYGHYSTDLFTNEAINIINEHDKNTPLFLYLAYNAPHAGTYEDPLQVPAFEEEKFLHIKDTNRRRYAAMVSRLDSAVGKVIEALQQHSMLDSSIIIFVSDNGAPTFGLMRNHGSNWPLKGEKSTPWEGGIKTVACVWSSLMKGSQGRISNQLMHISDWLPTLYVAAGGDKGALENIDGINLWEIISGNRDEVVNRTILHNIDEENGFGYAAIREGPYKLVNGTSMLGFLDEWFGSPPRKNFPKYDINAVKSSKVNTVLSSQYSGSALTRKKIYLLRNSTRIRCENKKKRNVIGNLCEPFNSPCLFDTFSDPCEKHNLYDLNEFKEIQVRLESKLNKFRKQTVTVHKTRPDKRSNPALYNNTWVNWGDYVSMLNC